MASNWLPLNPTVWMAGMLIWITASSLVLGANRSTMESIQDSGGKLMEEQASYDVKHYDLQVEVFPSNKRIKATSTIEVEILKPTSWLVLDLDTRLKVHRVHLGSSESRGTAKATNFEHRGTKLWIFLEQTLARGVRSIVRIDYSGKPRIAVKAPWDGGFTWSKTSKGKPWIATSVQGEGADLWWPCKDHPSDKPESFTLRATVPHGLIVASNGKLIEIISNQNGTDTFHWHTSFPISNYNVALNIAPYTTITTNYVSVTGESVPVTYWVLPENREKGEKLVPEMLNHLNFYERTLGPYPFRSEKYGVAETPHLGMEHQSIIAYGNQYKGGPHGYDWLHHHELGHEWWGNLVTVKDWKDFWIHEGLCTYMQALYAEEREGIMAYHHALYENRRRIKNLLAIVPETPSGMERMAKDNDPYFKGEWIIHMVRYLVGKEVTLKILRRFAYPSPELEGTGGSRAIRFVETSDFVQLAEEVSGRDLKWLFQFYLNQPKLPKLITEKNNGKWLLRWELPAGYDFPMPVEIESNGQTQRVEMPARGGTVELSTDHYLQARFDPNLWILKEAPAP